MFFLSGTQTSWAQDTKGSREASYVKLSKSWSGKKPVAVHVIRMPLTSVVEVKLALAGNAVGKLRRTAIIASSNNAVAAVNGSFFDRSCPYLPIGLIVIDGKIITKSLLNRSAIGISSKNGIRFGIPKFTGHVVNDSTKEKIPVWGINRPRKENEVIIFTPEYGTSTKTNNSGVELIIEDDMVVGISEGNSPIPSNGYVISFHGWTKNYANELPPGAPITADYSLTDGWDKFEQVITGGPRLVEDGENTVRESLDLEGFGGEVMGRNARTAIGITKDNELLLVVVDGKRFRSRRRAKRGVTYYELAELMKELGAKDAIGLDGGGSSTMYLKGYGVINLPSEGYEQAVSNALIVKYKVPSRSQEASISDKKPQ